jgi:hypothetical protein
MIQTKTHNICNRKKQIKFVSIIVLIILSQNVFGQHSIIHGHISFKQSLEPVSKAKIELINPIELNRVLRTAYSSTEGDFYIDSIENGNYNLLITRYDVIGGAVISDVLINSDDTLQFSIEIKDPCVGEKSDGICSKCNSNKKVVSTSPSYIHNINFHNNKSAEKYERKIRRRGFETIEVEGKETVIQIFLINEDEEFLDFCNNWFCKKCKIVFR